MINEPIEVADDVPSVIVITASSELAVDHDQRPAHADKYHRTDRSQLAAQEHGTQMLWPTLNESEPNGVSSIDPRLAVPVMRRLSRRVVRLTNALNAWAVAISGIRHPCAA